MIGDVRLQITEVDVTTDHLLLHIEVESARIEPFESDFMAARVEPVGFGDRRVATPPPLRFGLVRSDGEVLRPMGWRSVDGAVNVRQDAIAGLPSGGNGQFVGLFPVIEDRRMTFSPTINDRALFGSINLRKAEFRSF